jgi:hypothetical protein
MVPARGQPRPSRKRAVAPEDEVFANWFARNGTTPLGLGSWDGRYTFMGPRTTSISAAYAGFGHVAQGC